MAQPIPCDLCNAVVADWVITDQHDGSVMGLGIECILDWAVPIAEAFHAAAAHEGTSDPSSPVSPQVEDKAWEASAGGGRTKSEEAPAETAGDEDPEVPDSAKAADVDA